MAAGRLSSMCGESATSCWNSDVQDDLQFAFALADEADAITMARYRALDLRVEKKTDLTDVTDVVVECT